LFRSRLRRLERRRRFRERALQRVALLLEGSVVTFDGIDVALQRFDLFLGASERQQREAEGTKGNGDGDEWNHGYPSQTARPHRLRVPSPTKLAPALELRIG